MKTFFGLLLPIDAPSSISKLGRVIPGAWRSANGLHAEVYNVTAHHATGVSSRSTEMRWDTSSGRLIDAVETGWDLKDLVGHSPLGTPSPTPTAPPSPDCTACRCAGERILTARSGTNRTPRTAHASEPSRSRAEAQTRLKPCRET